MVTSPVHPPSSSSGSTATGAGAGRYDQDGYLHLSAEVVRYWKSRQYERRGCYQNAAGEPFAYTILTLDNGRTWLAVEDGAGGRDVLGTAEALYPGLLMQLARADERDRLAAAEEEDESDLPALEPWEEDPVSLSRPDPYRGSDDRAEASAGSGTASGSGVALRPYPSVVGRSESGELQHRPAFVVDPAATMQGDIPVESGSVQPEKSPLNVMP